MTGRASNELLTALGAAVRTIRIRRGLTQERLAEAAGLHTTYVSEVEGGHRNIGFVNVGRLAGALQVDLPTLMREVESARRGHEEDE